MHSSGSEPQLYWVPGTCARVPLVALEEIGEPFAPRVLDRYSGETESPEYAALNPKLKVPVLVLDDWVITEIPVILRVLSRRWPEAGLLPDGDERLEADVDSTLAWFASGVHPAAARQRFPSVCSGEESAWEGIRLKARRELEAAFKILEARMDEREWLFGEWSIVDVYMSWLWFRAVGSGMPGTPFPRCGDHALRCEERPSVARVLDLEEVEFDRFTAEGVVPDNVPPLQVGRLPDHLRPASA
ncbi:MAG TPA: glutathione S-transferase family protein [Solirubrobacterales bacterium]|nr:glutathione S-transferase family protein [Solirubrobacterales bacterium]